ncbi:uncharacterized protein [Clinocottus analis]|uniref:uncharacterized protein n=1 Tax=Clinocottus analis TaxID=304258 RepID=UPI0035BEB7D4
MMVMMVMMMTAPLLLVEASSSLLTSGLQRASACPERWLLCGESCFSFRPVWSSWTNAEEELLLLREAAHLQQVWLAGRQQNGSWFWSDDSPFRSSGWTNQRQGEAKEGGACMAMTPKTAALSSAPCGELRFYICSTRAGSAPSDRKPVHPGLVPGVSLADVLWSFSSSLAVDILHSSSFVRRLRSGTLTRRRYDDFLQQEALYLQRVSSTLEVLVGGFQEADEVTILLLDTLKQYRNQSLLLPLPSPLPPQWVQSSLLSFHHVVLEDPVYLMVALSARAVLRDFLSRELLPGNRPASGSEVTAGVLREWSADTWTLRYRALLEQRQQHMDVYRAINVFRDHMTNQRSMHQALSSETG